MPNRTQTPNNSWASTFFWACGMTWWIFLLLKSIFAKTLITLMCKRKVVMVGGGGEGSCEWLDFHISRGNEWHSEECDWCLMENLKNTLIFILQWVPLVHRNRPPHYWSTWRKRGVNWWVHTIIWRCAIVDGWSWPNHGTWKKNRVTWIIS